MKLNRYRINEVKLNIGEDINTLPEKVAKKLNKSSRRKITSDDILNVKIVRRSIDSRKAAKGSGNKQGGNKRVDNGEVRWVYTLDFSCNKTLDLPEPLDLKYEIPQVNNRTSLDGTHLDDKPWESDGLRPVVVGFGPCGMFCSLVLARAGLRPIVIERGDDVDTRQAKVEEFWRSGKLDTESNVQFGEGGAGTFSDGKLNTGINDTRIRFVIETFVEAGANPDILIDGRPHIGTDVLRHVVKNIREEIISLGGEVCFGTKLTSLVFEEGADHQKICGIKVLKNGEEFLIPSRQVVLALGHSARDTVRGLHAQGLRMEAKPFSMGVRVQHPQDLIDRGSYGKLAGHPDLPPAYYKLVARASDGRGVYSFCMCPGGEIVNAASQVDGVVTNGMSNHDRDSGYANSGILVDVRPEDYIEFDRDNSNPAELAGIAYQEYYEHLAFINGGRDYSIPTTTWGDYRDAMKVIEAMESIDTTKRFSDIDDNAKAVIASLPVFVARDIKEAMPVFGRKIKGFDDDDTIIKAIESRSSSPVRILRDKESLQAKFGVYPGGEGAGYAGGITSAAVDGIKIAERIIDKSYK